MQARYKLANIERMEKSNLSNTTNIQVMERKRPKGRSR